MPIINILVENKIAEADGVIYVCGNSDFAAKFDFDSEWDAYDTKTARFSYNNSYVDVVFSGNQCPIPIISDTYFFHIGVYAGNLHTTTPARVPCKKSILCGSGIPAAPPNDIYNKIMAKLNSLESADPEAIAKAVANYLAEHPVEETDPTVPEWAKAETKPTYTADEVGAISQDDLQTATNNALAQAKASGEFDGPAGAPGKDGAGMDITGATVGQIAKITAVDASGKPTQWEPVDMAEDEDIWEEIATGEFVEDTAALEISTDKNGEPFTLRKMQIQIVGTANQSRMNTRVGLSSTVYSSVYDYRFFPGKVSTNSPNIFGKIIYGEKDKEDNITVIKMQRNIDLNQPFAIDGYAVETHMVRKNDFETYRYFKAYFSTVEGVFFKGCKYRLLGVRA